MIVCVRMMILRSFEKEVYSGLLFKALSCGLHSVLPRFSKGQGAISEKGTLAR